jgi:demethylmenaquinone methyltransferase/2-methoxy-6-polyprenyl-1,4-benzoquinol methylase
MFTAIAPRYDLMNRLMTFGRDRVWRRTVVRLCALPQAGRLLDVATGTGDIAYEALRTDPTLRAVGIDLTREMMVYGRGKHPHPPAAAKTDAAKEGEAFPCTEGDALALPFGDNLFDAACSGFMMRNVTDIRLAFAEQARVVRPGGRVVCLEITRPAARVFRALFDLYFFRFVPFVGGLISGRRDAYTYLPHSTLAFPRPPELAQIMVEAGLREVHWRTAMLGTVAVHWGMK